MQLKSMRAGRVQLYTTGLDAEERQPHRRRDDRLGRRCARGRARARRRSRRSPSSPKDRMSSRSSPDAAALPPPASLAIHLDLVGGIAGDMFVAAMVDALPALASPCWPSSRGAAAGEPAPGFRERSGGCVRHQRDDVGATALRAASGCRGGDESALTHGARTRARRTRSLRSRDRTAAPLSAPTRKHALALLALLAEAEARVHGIAVDDVHFHELADWDSLLDVVAAGCIAAALEGAHWTASALPLGGGTVRTAHGAAAGSGAGHEPAARPAIRGTTTASAASASRRPARRSFVISCRPRACATRRATAAPGRERAAAPARASCRALPNIVRALVFERDAGAADDADDVTVFEFDVDDMTGEEIARRRRPAARRSPASSTSSIGTRSGKKGRPLADFRLLARPRRGRCGRAGCFTETSTLGLRLRDERRRVLPRAEVATAVERRDASASRSRERPGRRAHREGGARRRRRGATLGARRAPVRRRAARARGRRRVSACRATTT